MLGCGRIRNRDVISADGVEAVTCHVHLPPRYLPGAPSTSAEVTDVSLLVKLCSDDKGILHDCFLKA